MIEKTNNNKNSGKKNRCTLQTTFDFQSQKNASFRNAKYTA